MESNIYVSLLVPAFQVKEPSQIPAALKSMSLKASDIQELKSQEYAIKLENTLTLQQIESLIIENGNLRNQFDKCKESLSTMNSEFDKISNDPQALQEQDKIKFQKHIKKNKLLKEENKRLRQLLKSQLENSEKQRIETQTIIETLREELDLLVKELTLIK